MARPPHGFVHGPLDPGAGGGSGGLSYYTNFSLTENPISESSQWLNGRTDGRDWNDIQTTSIQPMGGLACSAQDAFVYNDCTALLSNPLWSSFPTQHVRAQVHSVHQNPNVYQEVELRFRSSLSIGLCTGYEVYWKVAQDGSQYITLARWDGLLGSFTLATPAVAGIGIADGYWIEGRLDGNILTVFTNGLLQVTFDISADFNGADYWIGSVKQPDKTLSNGTVYATGAPGFGMDEGSTGGSPLTDWGLYNFQALGAP